MKYIKIMPVLEESRRKNIKRHGKGHMRTSIPFEIRQFIDIKKGDFIEWEIDTIKKTMKGKWIVNDTKKKGERRATK